MVVELLRRNVTPLAEETLADTPITVISGARQVGKSMLMSQLIRGRDVRVVNLDDLGDRGAAEADPDGFASQYSQGLLAIDEVQRAPDLLTSLKASVDRDRRPVLGAADRSPLGPLILRPRRSAGPARSELSQRQAVARRRRSVGSSKGAWMLFGLTRNCISAPFDSDHRGLPFTRTTARADRALLWWCRPGLHHRPQPVGRSPAPGCRGRGRRRAWPRCGCRRSPW
ncbi:hypothetical protein MLP_03050 [Microlunatus phosphovorus NM-1]|uniref:AAA domain-containing protein n=1 Tax=Microlunatus phosphovorus (strain ATCC 700054 / DSM 10555 / JCM 9379 / NBRC 101784 / NCIMB 13414 / VKM Ac-1990 / NM-1) TaxID=1032480 RepID=F5XIZ3_MICPN|nr:hypothetical protein MLP_03050 [Microlunatus phosphovorus NM-1]